MSVFLLGGGRDVAVCGSLLEAFVGEARERATADPVIALLLVLEADDDASVERFRGVLEAAGAASAEIRVHAIVEGDGFTDAAIGGAAGVFVGGGLTPAYREAFSGIRDAVRERVADGMPYAGFSAGAAIAAGPALVGGFRVGEVEQSETRAHLDRVELFARVLRHDLDSADAEPADERGARRDRRAR
ncbi:Type 1 glutamine amidotransferase-like domain-containing protein [uncultured Microbacterium sp.]|uniref:Type 1 glutamine amidotransferase-like domain-containing protein n=1 Tax=uncultured Microbacterium sp. TaxID=191216 RepID=UPI0025E959AD|nr:Type 1 glutamine amidotransferase-like domain-containing protein [uncultured Microbacterium sp.]